MTVLSETSHGLLSLADRVYVINLPHREDRRREIAQQLERVGLRLGEEPVHLFNAVRPTEPGDFPSIGARGCFMSHLGVLRDAQDRGLDSILVLEDDADFTSAFLSAGDGELRTLAAGDWGIAYLGYHLESELGAGPFELIPSGTGVRTTHAMLLRRAAIARIIPYLEAILQRPPGDPAGGPMHVDGAYSWFRKDNPDVKTLVPVRQWAVQRSSATDIAERSWRDRLPLIGMLRRWKNRLVRR